MQAFAYARPKTLAEALKLLDAQWGKTEVLAGGTDLISLMKDGVAAPERVVSLKGIRELEGIRDSSEGLRIGALVTIEELRAHAQVREEFPALHEAAAGITSPQIRDMGTAGGDLLQRPRCWYFRAGFGLLARDAEGHALVLDGDNRYHAIFGNSGPAYFVSPSSLAPALITLGAKVKLAGSSGARELAVQDLFVTPKSEGEREHAIAPNEILTEILIPATSRGWHCAMYEVRQKEALDWPLATASVALKMEGGTISGARVVLGHVAPTPWPAPTAEKFLTGKNVTAETAAQAGDAAVHGATPLSRNRYKIQLARVAVKRALLACVEWRRYAASDERAAAAKGAF
jgi:xanthine dehydrogenase YagS FAD-binding subunit